MENARRFFTLDVNVLAETESGARLELTAGEQSGTFEIVCTPTTPELLERARRAEVTGRAAGMASLAERCAWVWQIQPDTVVTDALLFKLCGLLASVALGPVLPPDDSTLSPTEPVCCPCEMKQLAICQSPASLLTVLRTRTP